MNKSCVWWSTSEENKLCLLLFVDDEEIIISRENMKENTNKKVYKIEVYESFN